MRYYTSVHVHSSDFDAVKARVAALLEPGLDAYAVESQGWTAVYAARLEEQDPDDVRAFAVPLSELGRVVAFMVHDDANLAVLAFDAARAALAYADDAAVFDLDDATSDPARVAAALEVPEEGARAALTGGNASARAAGLAALLGIQIELATAGFDDLAELDDEDELPAEIELIEGPEAGKPGLGEFFGRSEDA